MLFTGTRTHCNPILPSISNLPFAFDQLVDLFSRELGEASDDLVQGLFHSRASAMLKQTIICCGLDQRKHHSSNKNKTTKTKHKT